MTKKKQNDDAKEGGLSTGRGFEASNYKYKYCTFLRFTLSLKKKKNENSLTLSLKPSFSTFFLSSTDQATKTVLLIFVLCSLLSGYSVAVMVDFLGF